MVALARPGASGDQGVYADRIELQGIRPRFPLPDFAAAYKYSGKWGYVRTAGMLRRINWDDTLDDAFDLSGDATGWGWNVSSNLKLGESDVLRMQFTVGEGIQNEMNDSPIDIGIAEQPVEPGDAGRRQTDPDRRVQPCSSITPGTRSSAARSATRRRTTTTPTRRRLTPSGSAQYALGNLLYYPVPNVMMGGELQWGRRENFSDGFHSDGFKIQFSFKYNFSWKLGG